MIIRPYSFQFDLEGLTATENFVDFPGISSKISSVLRNLPPVGREVTPVERKALARI
jgi:hypothetical protein